MPVLFITGAGGGIGAETTRLAVSRGHRVALADVDAEAARTVAGSLGEAALPIELDESLMHDDANAFADPPLPASVVAEAILSAVERRPLEVFIPPFRGRLLRALSTRPAIMRRLLLSAEKRGRKRLEELRRQRGMGR